MSTDKRVLKQELFNYLVKWGAEKTKDECFGWAKWFKISRQEFDVWYADWLKWFNNGGYFLQNF